MQGVLRQRRHIWAKIDLVVHRVPSVKRERDTSLQQPRRIRLHTCRVPDAETAVLGGRSEQPTQQPVPRHRLFLRCKHHGDRSRSERQRGELVSEIREVRLRMRQPSEGRLSDLAAALSSHHERGLRLPQLDSIGRRDHAREKAQARVPHIEGLTPRAYAQRACDQTRDGRLQAVLGHRGADEHVDLGRVDPRCTQRPLAGLGRG